MAQPNTIVEVLYPSQRGQIGLRGSLRAAVDGSPLSWDSTARPTLSAGDRHVFQLEVPSGASLELKLVRNEEDWSQGRNYVVHAGDHLRLEPCFDRKESELLPPESLTIDGESIAFRVLLPPTYGEQESKRYPVLYAQDGQSLWSTSEDPFGVWHLDRTLDQLYELGVIEEVIVVAIETSERRLERLSPVPDPAHGGGEAERHLRLVTEGLVAHVDRTYRTIPDLRHRALLGSSMGGLFSFYAAWTRPETFGKAACLSPSFWWADRHAIRLVEGSKTPEPRPTLYLDSGAAWSALESDANLRDGFHHTRSMFRALTSHGYSAGVDLHRLTFTGEAHNAAAWAARVAIPLQLLFPPQQQRPAPELVELFLPEAELPAA